MLLFLYFYFSYSQDMIPAPSPVYPLPSKSQMDWHHMEMNAFIHFSINTFTGREWGFGDESPALFSPSQADPEQWVLVLKNAGFRGIILTAKHHDGFCLWPSRYTEHCVRNALWLDGNGDVVGALSRACRKHGIRFGVYLSPWDRHHPRYGFPEYLQYYRDQLKELITLYGPFFEIWFDGANGGDGYYGGAREIRRIDGRHYYDWPGVIRMTDSLQPGVIFFSDAGPGCRWVGNESGVAGETNFNTITTDTLYAGKPGIYGLLTSGSPDGKQWVPAEADVSIRPGWFWHQKEDSLVKTPEELFDIYLKSVGRGALLLLNIPPDRRGLLHENDVKSLRGFRKLLDEAFDTNLLANATVTASRIRGNDARFAPENLLDNHPETYWALNDDEDTASVVFTLDRARALHYIVIKEHIALGQRVTAFRVEALTGAHWETLAEATTMGYKRILRLPHVVSDRIRITITGSMATPLISETELY